MLAKTELADTWSQYQTQFAVVQQSHKVKKTNMPAEMLQRYNAEVVGCSRAKLARREGALAAAKTMVQELELQKANDLTGHRHASCVMPYLYR